MEMRPILCPRCGRKLMLAAVVTAEIKCPRCGAIIKIEYDGQSEPHTAVTRE